MSAITSLPSGVGGGALNLISTQTASSSSTISFTSGIDSTYKEYIFKFINIHCSNDDEDFQFNLSADSGSNYNVTKTTTLFTADHHEGGGANVQYNGSRDLAQSTANVILAHRLGSDNDQSASGTLHLFDPSNTTFVKHFFGTFNHSLAGDTSINNYVAGYGNTTSAIDAVQFVMSAGTIDSGTIKLYGVS
tara:strand:- start:7 stop:579 length:573 start_codon:yes stop_codon:yes gene_type:complete